MSGITRTFGQNDGAKALQQFKPQQTRMKLGALKEGVKLAARIRDWEALEAAINAIIEEQKAFLAWWEGNVTPGKAEAGPGRGKKGIVPRQHLLAKDVTAQTGVSPPQISKWRRRLKDEAAYREVLRDGAYAAMWALRTTRGTQGTEEEEWYTPAFFLAAAREVLGEFDLDPASSAAAQQIVKAKAFLTKKEDGLQYEWRGRIWLNPPYTQPLIADFVDKLLFEVENKRTLSAILLTHNYTDTNWFQSAAAYAQAICFTAGRIRFESPEGDLAVPTQGQAFSYFGAEIDKFIAVFRQFGFVGRPT